MYKGIKINLKGSEQIIKLEESTPGSTKSGRLCPKDFISSYNLMVGQLACYQISNTDEFITDIKYQVNFLNNCEGDITVIEILEAINSSCLTHINRFNRLIDTDMSTYIDCAMHILESCDFFEDQSEILKIFTKLSQKKLLKNLEIIFT